MSSRGDALRQAGLKTRLYVVAALACFVLTLTTRSATPTFFPDDPLQVDNDRALDAGKAKPIDGSNAYDFTEHTFFKPGDHQPIRAVNINTLDEVPDSTWFSNRIGRQAMSLDEIARGPNAAETPDIEGWPIVEGKSSGITPGYRMRGSRRPPLPGEVRPTEQPGDGEQRRGDWRGLLSRHRLQRRAGLRR